MVKYPLFLWYPFFSGFGKIIELLKIVICSNVPLQNKAVCYDLSANVFSILIGKRNNELFCFAITASRILHNATSMNPLLLVFPKIGLCSGNAWFPIFANAIIPMLAGFVVYWL